ncbi:nuclear receptor coactivator NC0A-62 [Heterostelium album PN500]|uniref:Nuclear receptor coactivator NC0A-62 n=1 Tax=Heterostelium pallidum (strain ATCC 26659 / Pp 5 / PN500) TaxID=670386 RepID=D3AY53_HETP5|nr:nuclear receptor coactivator NC0A-62 [Heterostelium album PN500]EFA85880.1 nuclear receptor coactivator NC0A-62 [Heterostelium album PN500]|eukprot:XP_020437986.1 nuclear receptor coactivator NC0A-62 [Heterostelium album PN500]
MTSLSSILPAPKQIYNNEEHPLFAPTKKDKELNDDASKIVKEKRPPPPAYGARRGWKPTALEDYADGGAYPEIHIAQYPNDMGRKKIAGKSGSSAGSGGSSSKAIVAAGGAGSNKSIVQLGVDSSGRVKYEDVLGIDKNKIVYSQYNDLVPKEFGQTELERPNEEEVQEITNETKAVLDRLVGGKIGVAQQKSYVDKQAPVSYVKYTPSQQGGGHNSGAGSRVIRMVEVAKDPLEPPKFKIKKNIRRAPSPPAPVMHSPPKKLTVQEQQEWKIPPCISNWKNPKGYAIELDKRLAADGRGLQKTEINDKFAHFSQAFYIAEQNAREEVAARAELEIKLAQKEKEKKQEMLRKIAENVRNERAGYRNEEEESDKEEDNSSSSSSESESERERERDNHDNDRYRKRSISPKRSFEKERDYRRRDSRSRSRSRSRNRNRSRSRSRSNDRYNNSSSSSSSRRDRRDRTPSRERDRNRNDRINNDRNNDRNRDRNNNNNNRGSDSDDERKERDRIRLEKKREREREYRMEAAGKKSKMNRDGDRDISEKIALGQVQATRSEDSIFDQRLFNQSENMSSGFNGGDDESYNVYSKPLFGDKVSNSIYRPRVSQEDNESVENVLSTSRFKPQKEFSGADRTKERSGPVMFEKEKKSDPFGMDEFMSQAKKK